MSGKSILLDRISFLLPQLLYYEVHLVSSGPVRVCVSQKKTRWMHVNKNYGGLIPSSRVWASRVKKSLWNTAPFHRGERFD